MVPFVNGGAIEVQFEFSIVGWQGDGLLALDELFLFAAIGDQVLNAADFQPVLFLELEQLGQPGHRAVLVEDFADDGGGIEARQAGQIDGGLRVTCAPQDATRFALQREDMTGLHKICSRANPGCKHLNRQCAVVGADARGDAPGGVDGYREIRLMHFAVVGDHALQPQLAGALLGDRRANQPPAMLRHEIDGRIGDFRCRHDEIAFVFTISVISDDDHAALSDVCDGVRDGIKMHTHRRTSMTAQYGCGAKNRISTSPFLRRSRKRGIALFGLDRLRIAPAACDGLP